MASLWKKRRQVTTDYSEFDHISIVFWQRKLITIRGPIRVSEPLGSPDHLKPLEFDTYGKAWKSPGCGESDGTDATGNKGTTCPEGYNSELLDGYNSFLCGSKDSLPAQTFPFSCLVFSRF